MTQVAGKILLIDDEPFEKDILEFNLGKLHWKTTLGYYAGAEEAFQYLKTTSDRIFLILCDINMPKMNGLEFKKAIDNDSDLRAKAIPFIFLSTSATRAEIAEAYEYRVQGYFQKPHDTHEMTETLDLIIRYWIKSLHPNKLHK
ncbi:MAG: response regulator [Bacteroidota bacterium]